VGTKESVARRAHATGKGAEGLTGGVGGIGAQKPVGEEKTDMESKEWISLVIGIALWVWDAIRAWWNTLTWRDVLLLLILLGLWASLRDLGRILWRLRQLHEKVDEREDFKDFSRFYKRLQDVDDKIENILRSRAGGSP
jgi:hypothetical protein